MTWHDLSHRLYCPSCGAAPGSLCRNNHGDERRQQHWPRYATARVLAGKQLKPDRVPMRYRFDPPPQG